MDEGARPTLRPGRRWRFSVAQLLALLTLSAISLGLLGQPMHDARRQRAAVEAITAGGGSVVYEVGARPDRWLARWFGFDFAAEVWKVDFGDPRMVRIMASKVSHPGREETVIEGQPGVATGEVLRHVGDLKGLRRARLDNLPIRDEDLSQLRRLPTLFAVQADAEITDAGVAHLAALPRLAALEVRGRGITDQSALALSRCRRLSTLKLRDTAITAEGMRALSDCTDLWELKLSGAAIDNAGLEHLARLSKLQRLDLSGTQIGDAGLAHLERVPQLSALDLSGTRITDRGRIALAAVGLTSLTVNDTAVGRELLPAAVPQPRVSSLSLAGTPLFDESLTAMLPEYPALEYLDVSRTAVGDRSVAALVRQPNLERLNLSRTAMTAQGIQELCRKKPLRSLWIDLGQLTEHETETLRKRYPKLTLERRP